MNSLIGFIKSYCKNRWLRLHVPGHQGRCGYLNRNLGAKFDITEIQGADFLFESTGLIKKIELELTHLFKQNSVLTTNGSTACVQTMVALCKNKNFIAHRASAHISFFNACAMLNVKVNWFGFSNEFKEVDNRISVNEIECFLKSFKIGSCVVYLTSPNYYGVVAPVEAILKICQKFKALLLVDCAHGAHLNLLQKTRHPATIGAHLSCSSLHKTLPALTGAAVLSFDNKIFSKKEVKNKMMLFSSTSPSYLIMSSINFCVKWLKKKGKIDFLKLEIQKQKLINSLKLPFLKTDVSKLVIDCRQINLTGFDIACELRNMKIEPEFVNKNFVVMVISPFLKKIDWFRLKLCLNKIKFQINKPSLENYSKNKNLNLKNTTINLKKGCSYKFAVFANKNQTELVELNKAYGKISAQTFFKNTPGTILISAGEIFNFYVLKELKLRGLKLVEVLKIEK